MRVIARLTPRFLQVEEDNRKIREKSMWWDKISQAHKEKMLSVKALADQARPGQNPRPALCDVHS